MKDGVDEAGEFGHLEYLGSHEDPQVSDRPLSLGDAIACLMKMQKGVRTRLLYFQACVLALHITRLSLRPYSPRK